MLLEWKSSLFCTVMKFVGYQFQESTPDWEEILEDDDQAVEGEEYYS